MYYSTKNGYRIRYEIKGNGSGMLILHGLGGDLESMIPLSDNIHENFTRVLVDAPCHGKSDDFEISLVDLGSELISLMAYLGFKQFYSVGISLGSMILEEMMLDHPENILKSVLLAPASEIDSVTINTVSSWTASESRVSTDVFSEDFLKSHRTEIEAYDKAHPMMPERLYYLVPYLMNFSIKGRYSDSQCLMIIADHDMIFGERMVGDLQRSFRNSRIVRMNSGHAIHRQDPHGAAKIISEYIRG